MGLKQRMSEKYNAAHFLNLNFRFVVASTAMPLNLGSHGNGNGNGNNVFIERLKSIRKCSTALLQYIKENLKHDIYIIIHPIQYLSLYLDGRNHKAHIKSICIKAMIVKLSHRPMQYFKNSLIRKRVTCEIKWQEAV